MILLKVSEFHSNFECHCELLTTAMYYHKVSRHFRCHRVCPVVIFYARTIGVIKIQDQSYLILFYEWLICTNDGILCLDTRPRCNNCIPCPCCCNFINSEIHLTKILISVGSPALSVACISLKNVCNFNGNAHSEQKILQLILTPCTCNSVQKLQ